MASSCSPDADDMHSLLKTFMNAKNVDDQCGAFKALRSHVKRACRLNGQSSLSNGINGADRSTFLQMLMEFGQRKRIFLDQIDEVIKALDKDGGKEWQMHIGEIRTKFAKLTSTSSTSSETTASSCDDPGSVSDELKEGDYVEIASRGRFGQLVEENDGLWKVDLLDGTMCTLPKGHLRLFNTDTSWLEALNLSPKGREPAGHLHNLHAGLSELFSLLLATESDQTRKARFNGISFDYKREWERILTDKDLHYVIAGLVSSGKTTLTNSLLAHSIPGEWKGEMLPSAALENTAAVTMFSYNGTRDGKIRARIDAVRMTRHQDEDGSRYESHADPSSTTMSSMKELQEKIPSLLCKLTDTSGGFKRLMVEIPYPLDVISGMHEQVFGLTPSEVLVDTPGLDSVGLKEHLVSILAQNCFLYCFIVDVRSPSPFGNHGFEVLQFLTRNVEMMFPPVIIFTKFKLLEEESSLTTWKMANPGGLNKRLKDLVTRTLDKLEAAGVPHCPFFADVDALWASKDCNDFPEFQSEIQAARHGLSEFFKDLVRLGRNIATPLNQCRMLELQNQTTQLIINEIHREDGQRLLEGEDLNDLKKLGAKLKQDFSTNVDKYFNVTWTDLGIPQYEPQPPFNRDTCAISRIPAEFGKVFQSYKESHPEEHNKGAAVKAIVEETNQKIVNLITNDLSRYETDALDRFKASLWKKMGTKDADLQKHLDFRTWQYLVGVGLGGGAVLAGIVSFDSALAAGAATYFFTGAATLAGAGVFGVGLLVCAAWFYKDHWGAWRWDSAEKASWEAVLDACRNNCPKIGKHVKSGFDKKVDEIMKKIEDHRIVPSPETSECKAAKIQTSARQGYKDVAERLQTILKDKKERWLGTKASKPSILEQICKEVLAERERPESRCTLSMGPMST